MHSTWCPNVPYNLSLQVHNLVLGSLFKQIERDICSNLLELSATIIFGTCQEESKELTISMGGVGVTIGSGGTECENAAGLIS